MSGGEGGVERSGGAGLQVPGGCGEAREVDLFHSETCNVRYGNGLETAS